MAGESNSRSGKGRTIQVDIIELEKIVSLTQERSLAEAEHLKLRKAIELLTELLTPAPNNETAQAVLGEQPPDPQPDKPKPPGHGRKKPQDFSDAKKVDVAHPDLKHGDLCPCGCGGKIYRIVRKRRVRRFFGQPPLQVTFYELEQLRCNNCETVFPAPLPAEAGLKVFTPTAVSMLALYKYSSGQPFYRQMGILASLGVPVGVGTQYDVLAAAAAEIRPAHTELIRVGAQGKVAYVDDSSMKILRFKREPKDKRSGIHTTGIVSTHTDFSVGLFFTGRQHAGENMGQLRELREPNLPALIQMSDALSSNFACGKSDEYVIECCCLTHGRRNFVKILDSFPADCRTVIEAIGAVYHHDHQARDQKLDDEARLRFHQLNSAPVMEKLHQWFNLQFADELVEPNSNLGKAIRYMLNHWEELTQFLRVAGAPLDSNPAERALKYVIRHRKNSLFYRTVNGAMTGDLYMSLIYTCKLNGINPFHYLTELQRNASELKASAGQWMPWTYLATLERLKAPAALVA